MTDFQKYCDAYHDMFGAIDPDSYTGQGGILVQETRDQIDNLLLEGHGYSVSIIEKEKIAEESWHLFDLLYEYIGGYKSYPDFKTMAKTAEFFKFVYDRPITDQTKFKIENCLALGTYNKKAGIKMTSIAVNFVCFPKMYALAAARKLQKESLKFSWCEVSEKAEKFLLQCDGAKHIIKSSDIKKVYPTVEPIDEIYYKRRLTDTGDVITKRAFGKIQI